MPSETKIEPRPLQDLLNAVAEGNRRAFSQLYDATSAKLFGVTLRILHNRNTSEEVLQEVYLRIWDHAADYRPDKGSPMTWMITIARNRALDWRRRNRPEVPIDDVTGRDNWADPDPNPLEQTMADADARAIGNCLDELDDDHKQCIVMAYRDGYTHAELSQRFDAPLGTVKSWIRRGLLRLKECLER